MSLPWEVKEASTLRECGSPQWGLGIWGRQCSGSTSGCCIPGENEADGREVWGGEGPCPGAQREARHTHGHTQAFNSDSLVYLSPCRPALNMFTFNKEVMCHLRETRWWKNKGFAQTALVKLAERFTTLPTYVRRTTHAPRHERFFIALLWNVSHVGQAVFVFYHPGCHTHCVQWQQELDGYKPPHKHIYSLLTAGTWSPLALTWLCSRTQAADRNVNSTASPERGATPEKKDIPDYWRLNKK